MKILVFNCGSSSLNYKVFRATDDSIVEIEMAGKAHRVGVTGTEASFIEHRQHNQVEKHVLAITDHRRAAQLVLEALSKRHTSVDIIGHRFVHGGEYFQTAELLTPLVMTRVEDCLPLAPLHNPSAMSVIRECRERLPDIPQYITFDTAFHTSIPPYARTYALPQKLRQDYGLHRYGFHGLSYQYVAGELIRYLNRPLSGACVVACHLGTGGSSVAAIKDGCSFATSMGYSPLSGLVMSTRPGDVDPLALIHMGQHAGSHASALSEMLNKRSGLLGLSGLSSDIRDIIREMENSGGERVTLAFQVYTTRLRQYIGGCAAAMGGFDTLVFTDDIGVQSWQVREEACRHLAWAGLALDAQANRDAPPDRLSVLSKSTSRVLVLALPTDEERVIGAEGVRLWKEVSHAAN